MKRAIVLGGGGFIGGHLSKRLKDDGYHVVVADIKNHEFWPHNEICHEFIKCDLTDPKSVELVISENTDELYQLAADMGGAGYIFTGENDANVMYNSALINLNVAKESVLKKVKKVFYSSSACMYPEYNQLDPDNPNCEESSAYPANPDSEYGWEKLFSERMFLAFNRNHNLNVRIARFHNIFGPQGTWIGGKEKAPAAMLRKAAQAKHGETIEVWGDGLQTRSFLFVDECVEAVLRLMNSNFMSPVNIGSEEMVTINQLAKMAIEISQKDITIKNIDGEEFLKKYGFNCPVGVRGRNSDNTLFYKKIGWKPTEKLYNGMKKSYKWIHKQVNL
jgi:nucleoside-diphosphate-sugar epimerase